eukprot:scaffold5655_cov282-Prasinococcus_capsulatus_cf.AAC.2
MLRGMAAAMVMEAEADEPRALKAAYRRAVGRWHPDKFEQAFGARLHPAHRAAVLARVQRIAQRLNAAWAAHNDAAPALR